MQNLGQILFHGAVEQSIRSSTAHIMIFTLKGRTQEFYTTLRALA